MNVIIQKSLKDIFSKDVLFFVLQMGFVSILISITFIWYLWETLSLFISSYLAWIPWEWLQTTGAKVITFALVYMVFIIVISLLTSIYSEKLLIKLAKKHYPEVKVVGSVDLFTSISSTLKASALFLLYFLLCIPILFIPILGQLVMLFLWSILIKEPTVYDVGSLFIDNKKLLKEKTKKITILSMLASSFNYIPLLNIFAPIFAQILFLHHVLSHKE